MNQNLKKKKKRVSDKKYYLKNREKIIQRTRQFHLRTKKPCPICGKPICKDSIRCTKCYLINKKLSKEERVAKYLQAKELHSIGLGAVRISKKLGISRSTIRSWIYDGVSPWGRSEYQSHTLEEYDNAMKSLKNGEKISKVSRILDIKKSALRSWINGNLPKEVMGYRNVDDVPRQISLSKEKAYILGTLCTDGWIFKNRIGLGATDRDFVEKFASCIKEVYNIPVKISQQSPHRKKQIFLAQIGNRYIANDLKKLYIDFKSPEWYIPEEIRESDELLCNFLMAMFDGDGGITFNKQYPRVYLYSINKKGLNQVRDVLKRFAIHSCVYNGGIGRSAAFLLICQKGSINNFYTSIGFSIERKVRKLENAYMQTPRRIR